MYTPVAIFQVSYYKQHLSCFIKYLCKKGYGESRILFCCFKTFPSLQMNIDKKINIW